jgi:hypothetical protein
MERKGFEPSTSALRTQNARVLNAGKQTTCDDALDLLHQWLHLQGEFVQLEALANALRERLTADQLRELVKLLSRGLTRSEPQERNVRHE